MIQNYRTNLPGFCTQSLGLRVLNQKGQKRKSHEGTGGLGEMRLQPVHLRQKERAQNQEWTRP